jgi:hypothetical protein
MFTYNFLFSTKFAQLVSLTALLSDVFDSRTSTTSIYIHWVVFYVSYLRKQRFIFFFVLRKHRSINYLHNFLYSCKNMRIEQSLHIELNGTFLVLYYIIIWSLRIKFLQKTKPTCSNSSHLYGLQFIWHHLSTWLRKWKLSTTTFKLPIRSDVFVRYLLFLFWAYLNKWQASS